jgi:adenylate cyclase
MAGHCEVGILFADIAGSTRIYELLGDTRAHAIVTGCLRTVGEVVAAHGGIVVKTIGDEMMVAFHQPLSMYTAAVNIQRRITQMPRPAGLDEQVSIAMRIGFHFGPALHDNQDFYGDSVNVAARVVALAKANQILTTGEFMYFLPSAQRAMVSEFGRVDVKGHNEPLRIARVAWEEKLQSTTVIKFANAPAPGPAALNLRLVFEGRKWQVPDLVKTICCGRDAASDIILKGSQVSRTHATIERRNQKVVLLDHSSNGTFLELEGKPLFKLHREEFRLIGQGRIDFGEPDGETTDHLWFYVS